MQLQLSLKLLPDEASDDAAIRRFISSTTGKKLSSITGYQLLKKSLDARGNKVFINLRLNAFIDEPFIESAPPYFEFRDVSNSTIKIIIIGAGPAGLFAALKLIRAGIRPIILERGKDVRSRRRDLAVLNK
ncbi:MAG TPA: FAD-dependent monooxygenase, partial [Ferruginibacter sp.]|nr:FAD-dependent monooxygenase [Ferruginibacter sp.]